MKKQIFNICNIYTFLWVVFHTKGTLYSADIISILLYIVLMAISGYYAVLCYTSRDNPPFVKAYNVLFVLLVVYGIINYAMGDINSHLKIPKDFYLQCIVKSMLPFYAFYAFAKKGMITKKWICFFTILFVIVSMGEYYTMDVKLAKEYNTEVGEITNNFGYVFISLIPLCCFFDKRKLVQYFLLAVCSIYTLISLKRGAILSGAACLILFFIGSFDRKMGSKQIMVILLSIVFVYLGYHLIINLMDTNTYFVTRVEATMEGYSSGRDFLYSHYWNMFWNENNPFYMIIGHGADATIRSGYNYAHNDWLEILINQGLIGIIIFAVFWIQSYKLWYKMPKSIIKIAFGMCIITLFLKTFFSMSINDMTIYSTLVLGLGASTYNNESVKNLLIN